MENAAVRRTDIFAFSDKTDETLDDDSSLEGHSIILLELSMMDLCSDLSMSFKLD